MYFQNEKRPLLCNKSKYNKIDDTATPTVNKWDANSIDSTGALRLLVSIRHPEVQCPFRAIQGIMNIGLNRMREISPETGFIRISKFIKKD